MESIQIKDLQKKYQAMDFDVVRIEANLDIKKLLTIAQANIDKHGTQQKDGYKDYFGLGLQYFDESNPYFDSIQANDYSKTNKKIFFKKNEIAENFSDIYDCFDNVRLSRGRIIIAKPGFKMTPHTDGHFMMTLHVPLKTQAGANIIIDNKSYHLPADGCAYLINATKLHWAENRSNEDRIHITFPIGPPSFVNWTSADIAKYQNYFEMMGLKPEQFHMKIVNNTQQS